MRTRATLRTKTAAPPRAPVKTASVDRLRALAHRCRAASEETAMPELSQEMVHIAEAIEAEADTLSER